MSPGQPRQHILPKRDRGNGRKTFGAASGFAALIKAESGTAHLDEVRQRRFTVREGRATLVDGEEALRRLYTDVRHPGYWQDRRR